MARAGGIDLRCSERVGSGLVSCNTIIPVPKLEIMLTLPRSRRQLRAEEVSGLPGLLFPVALGTLVELAGSLRQALAWAHLFLLLA